VLFVGFPVDRASQMKNAVTISKVLTLVLLWRISAILLGITLPE